MFKWKDNKRRIKAAFKLQFSTIQGRGTENSREETEFLSSRSFPIRAKSHGSLKTSHSFTVLSESGSDVSPGNYTPMSNGIICKSNLSDCTGFLSPFLNNRTPKKLMTGSCNWSSSPAPDRGTYDASANNLSEVGSARRLEDSDDSIEKLRDTIIILTRKVELSELELQTLRKKIVKERRRGEDLVKEIIWLKGERNALKRKCEELMLSQLVNNYDVLPSNTLQLAEEKLSSVLEDVRRQLNHEKETNVNLHIQLQKTQETNARFMFAVRDLDVLLEQRNQEMNCTKCRQLDTNEDFQDFEFETEVMHLQKYQCSAVLLEGISETEGEAKCNMDAQVDEYDNLTTHYLQKKIIDLKNELELLKKEREDMEMHAEQLTLDYEILKQKNHEISSKLELSQMHEQLKVQYECPAHLCAINDLQAQVEHLENEIRWQHETFQSDLETILRDKVEQEKRALLAEEELEKIRRNNVCTAKQLQEEVKSLSAQLSTTFLQSEKLVMQAQQEASELSLQKRQLEQMLVKTSENLTFLQDQYHGKLLHLLGLIDYESRETDRLIAKLKGKHQELENYRNSQEAILNASFEEVQSLKYEIEILKAQNGVLLAQIQKKQKQFPATEDLASSKEVNHDLTREKVSEINSLNQEKKALQKKECKSMKEPKIRMLNSVVAICNNGQQ